MSAKTGKSTSVKGNVRTQSETTNANVLLECAVMVKLVVKDFESQQLSQVCMYMIITNTGSGSGFWMYQFALQSNFEVANCNRVET